MIAVDTNLLVYAHRTDSPHHGAARDALAGLVDDQRAWGVPWPCVHEFLAVVTHSRIYVPPTAQADALQAVDDLLALPGCSVLGEASDHWQRLRGLLEHPAVTGPRVHDARVAAICLGHAVHELWTVDRDFAWFPQLRTRNPLVG